MEKKIKQTKELLERFGITPTQANIELAMKQNNLLVDLENAAIGYWESEIKKKNRIEMLEKLTYFKKNVQCRVRIGGKVVEFIKTWEHDDAMGDSDYSWKITSGQELLTDEEFNEIADFIDIEITGL